MQTSSFHSASDGVRLSEALIKAGLAPRLAYKFEAMPQRTVVVEPRGTFHEPGRVRNEVIFVLSGILAKFKVGPDGRRQIVSLRFPGDGMLPSERVADFGIQAIVRSRLAIGRAEDFNPLVDANPELARFFWHLTQKHAAIGYEWLVNCARRGSTARVAHLLCETAERLGISPPDERMFNPFTQQQIADITGQTSVNVNRVFADLERQGIIRREGREIVFCDWMEIQRVASFQPAYLS